MFCFSFLHSLPRIENLVKPCFSLAIPKYKKHPRRISAVVAHRLIIFSLLLIPHTRNSHAVPQQSLLRNSNQIDDSRVHFFSVSQHHHNLHHYDGMLRRRRYHSAKPPANAPFPLCNIIQRQACQSGRKILHQDSGIKGRRHACLLQLE